MNYDGPRPKHAKVRMEWLLEEVATELRVLEKLASLPEADINTEEESYD